MDISTFETLHQKGFVTAESLEKIKEAEKKQLVSLHWDLKTILYLGVLLFSTGMGMLVYQNIDSIGHAVVITVIAGLSVFGFYYAAIKKQPFTWKKVESPNVLFDYLLLLSCLLMVTFFGYIQYQYQLFGNHYGLASLFPMLLLFASAYFYDHLGVLSMAITNLGAWLGLSLTPLTLIKNYDWNTEQMIYTGIALGALLVFVSFMTTRQKLKSHFSFTYFNFGMHLLMVSLLAELFQWKSYYLLWFLCMVPVCALVYWKAIQEKSFYFLLFAALYGYVALSYVVIKIIIWLDNQINESDGSFIFLGFAYFMVSAAALILLLHNMNKKFNANDRI